MKRTAWILRAALLVCSSLAWAEDGFAIRNVRVFDGERILPAATVIVQAGRIAAVIPQSDASRKPDVPAGLQVRDGSGQTLIPGLIDSHVHILSRSALGQALRFGVTTVIDMFSDVGLMQSLQREQAAGLAADRAELVSCGTLATCPEGHGTQYGIAVPTLSAPAEAQAFVDARLAEGSDFIKIIFNRGLSIPSLDESTMAALVQAAHARRRLAAVHINALADARAVIRAGGDILAHAWSDMDADAALLAQASENHTVLIPTLAVLNGVCGLEANGELAADPDMAPFLPADALSGLKKKPNPAQRSAGEYDTAVRAVQAMRKSHARILAGTDVPNANMVHGASLHSELSLLVAAGLSPVEALAAATSAPADVFGLSDRGRIAAGKRADLLLVSGDPCADIRATRRIVSVWKGGIEIERSPAVPQKTAEGPGIVADFEKGTVGSRFGSGWQTSTDAIRGGQSLASIGLTAGGADGSRFCLSISGEVKATPATASFAWAGAILFTGERPFAPRDLSAVREIVFWIQGDVPAIRLMLYAENLGLLPAIRQAAVTGEWRQVAIPLSDLKGIDPARITAIAFTAGPAPGRFSFHIDQIELR